MIKNIVDIEQIVSSKYRFEAHYKETINEHQGETIKEHTDKCLKYFEMICKEKNMNKILEKLEQKIIGTDSNSCKEFFKTLFVNTITFHDVGKVNPLFQKDKMKNEKFKNAVGSLDLGSTHSFISAIVYLQYFLPLLDECNPSKETKRKMRQLIYINAYVISKHHGSLANFIDFVNGFDENRDGNGFILKEAVFKNIDRYLENATVLFGEDEIKKSYRLVRGAITEEKEYNVYCYTYERLLYSLLVASDYYATTEQMDGFVSSSYGTIEQIEEMYQIFSKTEVCHNIRKYETEEYSKKKSFETISNINDLRTEMFLETEDNLLKNLDANMYYIEAPTGSGKSNTALNLSFQLIRHCKQLNKIMYIYPFNTLVEQNRKILDEIFECKEEAIQQIRVVNSITPIVRQSRKNVKEKEELDEEECKKALLDRQFFNYPIAVSTHVTLFDIMFGRTRESAFPFHQLANSVVVLDEIQSYRNEIWTEMITFLKIFAEVLNMKIIIMSATLPNLDILSKEQETAIRLVNNTKKYYLNPLFKNRVALDYSLLGKEDVLSELKQHIQVDTANSKKVLVEFLKKKTAVAFYRTLKKEFSCEVYCMTGDDNSIERSRILNKIEKSGKEVPLVLIATQVIEAGVDLKNIDIGFKDISIIDSEEQFMGRVNRSHSGSGTVYFFNYDDCKMIYRNDVRAQNKLSLMQPEMQHILEQKTFDQYYEKIFECIQKQNESLNNQYDIHGFWLEVGRLNQIQISEKMKLIQDDTWSGSVYLASKLETENGTVLDGEAIWKDYKALLQNKKMESYAVFKAKLSIITSKMNYFIYRIKKNDIPYYDRIGELYYVENGDAYFTDGKLDTEKFETQIGIFI